MNKRNKVLILSGIGLLAVGGIAYAAKGYQDHKQMRAMFSPQKLMAQVDTNSDQAISIDELNLAVGERFKLSDADGDGRVSKPDLVKAIEERAPVERMKRNAGRIADRLFIGLDLDEDGMVALNEVENRIAKFHALADWNDDGKVELSEIKRLRHSMPGRWGKRKDMRDKGEE